MLPGLLRNANRVHEFITEVLKQSGGTFEFKGPCFANMDMLVTADPAIIHHILSKNFSNYPKGPEFKQTFEILGDGIFNADSELWETHRKTTMSLINCEKFYQPLQRTSWEKVEKGLISVLDRVSELGIVVDLQDLFQRFTFDSICILVLGYDPGSLSIALPHIPCEKAFGDAEEALLYRHVLPERFWKLQQWLQIGKEKKLSMAWVAFDQFLSPWISSKLEDLSKSGAEIDGRGTTSTALTWFFWLLAINPSAETKIREEIKTKLDVKDDQKWRCFTVEELRKLVYLHGALCEALRLFPPLSLELKTPIQPDILPSGQQVDRNTRTILSFYSMGRMETIWGQDCLEFKPERWISDRGGIKHEPSYKFPAFNAGPRTCLEDEETAQKKRKMDVEEMGDSMKSLENKTLDSKREMDNRAE
ncbi:hypothetical protein F0562_009867 [Nyssa sinensis]|uniref:Cytochrome P450 n=1 Tax=Nyssa sinensis TaxID=561372 RepID=A0A5J4ZZW5_9ASTE|nr:hypothetical protein F0562_009867 [Nyssa sinensis]